MSELERVRDAEIVEDIPSWEECVSEWSEGASQELIGQLRQARAAASVGRHYGWSSMKQFAGEIGASTGKVYDYAKVWTVYGHIFEDGGELSSRLETLGISHLIKALRAPDPVATAEEAHDEGLSARQIEERIKTQEEEEAEEVQIKTCPACGSDSKHWQRVPEGLGGVQ